MRLILHAGTHKTGTTSIQHVLADNRDWLRERGCTFAQLADCGASHNHFAHKLALADEGGVEALRAELLGLGDPDRTLVVSAEEFSARILGTRHWDGFDRDDYRDRKRAYLARLKAVSRDFDEVTVLLCFRRHDEFAASLYATNILSDRFRWSFDEFRARCAPIFDYAGQTALMREAFADVRLAAFDALKGDLLPAFCDWAGIPTPPGEGRHDKITPDMRLVWWLALRGRDANEKHRRHITTFIRSAQAGRVFRGREKATLWTLKEQRADFLANACTDPAAGFFPPAPRPAFGVPAELSPGDLQAVDDAFEDWLRATRGPSPVRSLLRSVRRLVAGPPPTR